jgi:hypothetical protein
VNEASQRQRAPRESSEDSPAWSSFGVFSLYEAVPTFFGPMVVCRPLLEVRGDERRRRFAREWLAEIVTLD